ncbi:MAG: Gfo/Idh/MocA family oxidoreductase [Scandinavium sp.]|uniref:Gfo/Idh/MocA family oxidoreductase n=1 Tax=Scandinavium sp. TaxID=2830653 RepID=UPI003F3827A3
MHAGFIGLGAVVETAYLPALRRLFDSSLRCSGFDIQPERQPHGVNRSVSLAALLAEPLDTLFITTSSLWHLPVLEQALQSDIPRIVVEKPVAASLAQLEHLQALLALPENRDRVLALDHWMARDGVTQLIRGKLENDWQPEAGASALNPFAASLADIVKIEGFLLEPSGFNEQGEPIALNFATGEPDTRTLRHPDGVIVDIGTHVLAMMHETLAAAGANNQLVLTLTEASDRLGKPIAQGDLITAEGRAHLQGEISGVPFDIWLNKYAGPSGGQKGIRLTLRDGTVLSQDRSATGEVLELAKGETLQRWTLSGPVYERCLQRMILGENSLFRRAPQQISQFTQRRIAEVTALLQLQQQLRGPH